jgi:acetolactate synthase small subunit
MFRSLYLSRPWSSCFEGEDDAAKAAADKAAADKATADAAAAATAGKTFTQEDLNRFLAEDRRKHQTQLKEQAEKLETVLKNSQLTEQDRKVLQENLEAVKGQLRSAEAAAAKEKQELEQAFQGKLVDAEKKSQIWEGLYRESMIQRSLQDAAVKGDAWQPGQIVTLMKPMTKLVACVDPTTNRPNGQYEVQIEMLDTDPKTGQQVMMNRTPEAAVARMKELPEQFGNLFKSGVVSGIGSSSATGGLMPGQGGKIDVRKLTPTQYREIREKNPELLGLAPKRR